MNRRVRYGISMVVAFTTFLTIKSLGYMNLETTIAYASSYELTDLQMETPGGNDINLYEKDNYTREINSNESLESTYYAKILSDRSKVVFRTSGFSGTVKIFKDRNKKVYDEGDEIPVLTGKTTFYIRLYDTYDEQKTNDCKREYRVTVKRYTSEQEEEIKNDDQSNIYLQTLELDYGDIPLSFDRLKSTYNVKVDADVKSIAIKAEPEDGSTTVKINNIAVDENNDYKKMINIDRGNNVIEISLSQSDEEKRKYILNINRTENPVVINENTNTTDNKITENNKTNIEEKNKSENNISDDKSPNKWIKVSDKWRYSDSYGNPIKNTWFYDNNYKKTYYFNNEGNMVAGWLNLNNDWYYLNNDGSMQTGWKQIGYNWYYLNYDGKMKTGWFKDSDGKYYYFYQSTGVMAHDTTISGYKLGSNGAWKK